MEFITLHIQDSIATGMKPRLLIIPVANIATIVSPDDPDAPCVVNGCNVIESRREVLGMLGAINLKGCSS